MQFTAEEYDVIMPLFHEMDQEACRAARLTRAEIRLRVAEKKLCRLLKEDAHLLDGYRQALEAYECGFKPWSAFRAGQAHAHEGTPKETALLTYLNAVSDDLSDRASRVTAQYTRLAERLESRPSRRLLDKYTAVYRAIHGGEERAVHLFFEAGFARG